jgi:hypothetical protein
MFARPSRRNVPHADGAETEAPLITRRTGAPGPVRNPSKQGSRRTMKRIKLLGLTVVAVFAFSAVAVASASAALPELVGVTSKGTVGGTIEGASKAETKTVLETKNGSKVTCNTAKSTGGKATNTKESTGNKVTFTGCVESIFGGKCENTATAGEIVTNTLKGVIGYVEGSAKKEVGLELTPESTAQFVTFECTGGFAKIEVKGAVIGQLGAGQFNLHEKALNLVFVKGTNKGEQKIKQLEGKAAVKLESSLNKGAFEESNQQGEGTIKSSVEEIELKA